MNKTLCVALAAMLPFAAHADKLGPLADAPPAFQAECASCHVAFPPQLLRAEDWKQVMAKPEKHYGDNASLDEKTRRVLEDFLVKNAGGEKLGAGRTAGSAELPRLTQTAWFTRKHREVSRSDWTSAKVKTAANCAACHTKAAEGSYREREIVMPNGKRRED